MIFRIQAFESSRISANTGGLCLSCEIGSLGKPDADELRLLKLFLSHRKFSLQK